MSIAMKKEASKAVYCIATLDTKGPDAQFVANLLKNWGHRVVLVDVGTQHAPTVKPDLPREVLADSDLFAGLSRAEAIEIMSAGLTKYLVQEEKAGRVAAVLGMGGSGGTALICPAFRELPIGLPKIMISTVASGNTRPHVGTSDIFMVFPVVDVAGLNRVSRVVYSEAAGALAGMVEHPISPEVQPEKAVGITMFGVTTTCVTQIRHLLKKLGWECFIFHATGTGGRAMESLVTSGLLDGVIDLTTTEVADEIAGGIFPAGPERMDAILKAGIPYIVSAGAMDMVNFGALESVPAQYQQRKLHKHNQQITLMRTTPEENHLAGKWIANKLVKSEGPWRVILPMGGVSALDAPGMPFEDPKSNDAFFDSLEKGLESHPNRVIRDPRHINDSGFAQAVVSLFLKMCEQRK